MYEYLTATNQSSRRFSVICLTDNPEASTATLGQLLAHHIMTKRSRDIDETNAEKPARNMYIKGLSKNTPLADT